MSLFLDRKLEIFRMAATLKHFSGAAEALGMTQPNVTQQLAVLEQQFGVALFERDGHRMRLTAAGTALLSECDRLFDDVGEIRRRVRNAAHGMQHYRIGGTMTAGGYVLPEWAAQFMDTTPHCRISIRVANTQEIEELLKRRSLDLALVEGPFDRNYFLSNKIMDDELIPVAATGVLAPVFSLQEYLAADGRLILRESGSGTRYYLDTFLQRQGLAVNPDSVIEVNNFDALKLLVRGRHGITVISPLAVSDELAAGTLIASQFAEGKISRELNFIYSATGEISFAEKFIRFCRKAGKA